MPLLGITWLWIYLDLIALQMVKEMVNGKEMT